MTAMRSTRKRPPLDPPAAPKPGRRDSEAIVNAIIDAALGLPPNSPMATIAKRAGVGEASLYRYFPTRGALHAELTRRFQRHFRDAVQAVTETPNLSVEDGLRQICTVALMLPKEWRRIADLAVPFTWSESHAAEVYGEVIALITTWVSRQMPTAPPDLPSRVFIAFASVRGIMIMSSMMPEQAPDVPALLEYAVATVLTTLRAS
jgi:AcrR family transcriptional regulator